MRLSRTKWMLGLVVCLLGIARPGWAGTGETPTPAVILEGRELFVTDWTAAGREASRGDGLGPIFNERSCVACHLQGGIGGAGGSRVDVMILTDVGSKRQPDGSIKPSVDLQTKDIFPGLAAGPSLVIHRFSTDPSYEGWRMNVLKQLGVGSKRGEKTTSDFRVEASFRNTPALFGDGLIDAIPDSVLEANSRRNSKGHLNRLKDGRIGRFGWKAQSASLGEFVRGACANELGLENPGHPQPADPLRPNYKAPGNDLTDAECKALTSFIAALPRPVSSVRPGLLNSERIEHGRQTFVEIGCADCHTPNLGDVEGIYSDLMVHDMGVSLQDGGHTYYGVQDESTPELAKNALIAREWKTPPLWGLRDSAPYLHDGRARTIAEAIKFHDAEARNSTRRYASLAQGSQQNINLFLESLTAPPRPDGRKAKKR